ncbi:hypothetical protein IV38_GL000906 [Lactobacillus selangorensis]|uniref:Uncharacterized protein n=1 Tax=Lactobacillus selangorensis TaxID=81857 RepID=A0A0R2FXM8_9LACO|nr:hypothetical protein [Lactobacillus selangorensis]KRN28702.1 hypothetical protein IV38_GL000906 [Lactobacillus selangorensis]KRN32888.1 hypothetical protein IV40_GL000948 [Lactobacillus selangorensis]
MIKKIRQYIRASSVYRYLENKTDRVILFSSLTTVIALILALIKLGLGMILDSAWLLGFGSYYLMLVLGKVWLTYRYTKIRKDETQAFDQSEYFWGGILFSLLGLIFAVFCLFMAFHGLNQHFAKLVTYLIALIGFVKIISASISLVRGRRLHNPLVNLLKSFNVANGAVALVLTQYAILMMKGAPYANYSTGLFGCGIGLLIVLIGLGFIWHGWRVN